jgi:hypothetical protein
LIKEFALQAVVMLPKGMFEPYTPNPTCFLIFRKTGRPTENVWFYNVEGDGSSLKKARKFGPQYKNDFPDLLAKWPKRETQEGRAWLVPAQKIIDNNYNMTLSSLGLVKPEKIEHPEPEEILESVAAKQEKIFDLIEEMRQFLINGGNGKGISSGWGLIKIGNEKYFKLIMGQSPPASTYKTEKIGLPFFQGKAEFGELYPAARKYCSQPNRIAEKDDVLISVRAPVGPTNLSKEKCCIGRGLAAIRCINGVLPRFLLYALRSMENQISGSVMGQGGGFTAIKKCQLKEVEIPIPPIPEQEQIIAKIEQSQTKAEQLKQLQAETEAELANFVPALLAKAFRGEL